jgi:hypothetical protein
MGRKTPPEYKPQIISGGRETNSSLSCRSSRFQDIHKSFLPSAFFDDEHSSRKVVCHSEGVGQVIGIDKNNILCSTICHPRSETFGHKHKILALSHNLLRKG